MASEDGRPPVMLWDELYVWSQHRQERFCARCPQCYIAFGFSLSCLCLGSEHYVLMMEEGTTREEYIRMTLQRYTDTYGHPLRNGMGHTVVTFNGDPLSQCGNYVMLEGWELPCNAVAVLGGGRLR